jgi:hypothetical protein
MIDKSKFLEILPGLWYEVATGLPWSSKYKVRNPTGYGTHCCFGDNLKRLKSKSGGYYNVRNDSGSSLWHQIVWNYFNGPVIGNFDVDHKDNNRLNCKIENLQLLSHTSNTQKKKMQSNNTSGYVGVVYRKDSNKYRATIVTNQKKLALGSYDTPEEAYEVYLKAKVKHHGIESINPLEKKEG